MQDQLSEYCKTNSPSPLNKNSEFTLSDLMIEGFQQVKEGVEVERCSSGGIEKKCFPFLKLPFEIRLIIYGYLLPARNHTVVTQYPHNGYYYSKPLSHSSQTLYPAWSSSRGNPPISTSHILTTYKILNANFHTDFPSPSICTAIFRSCKQILAEAESVLYTGAMFDFGVYVDAVVPFFLDRSEVARRCVRSIKMAREIPQALHVNSIAEASDESDTSCKESSEEGEVDPLWSRTCELLRRECTGLRTVDLTVWAETGSMVELPVDLPELEVDKQEVEDNYGPVLVDDGHLWKNWEWTSKLLECEGIRHVKVTWWGFAADKIGLGRFDSWLGRRMVADKLVRDRMVWEGCVVEGVCVVSGGCQTLGSSC